MMSVLFGVDCFVMGVLRVLNIICVVSSSFIFTLSRTLSRKFFNVCVL